MIKRYFIYFLCLISTSPLLVMAQNADVDPQGTSTCVLLNNNLRYRATDIQVGGEVTALQDFLQANGYLKVSPSGYFGLLTTKGVKSFQSDNNISPTGYVGPLTRAKIQVLSCDGTTPTVPVITNQISTAGVSGCNPGAMFNSMTGVSCQGTQIVATTTLDSKVNIHLSSSLVTSDSGITTVIYNVGVENPENKPASVGLEVSCPSGVTVTVLGEDVSRCNRTITMKSTGVNGSYTLSLTFKNSTQQSQLIGSMATAYNTLNQAIGSDKDGLNIPANVPNPPRPTITILSPNGGENYTVGTLMPITFSTNLADQKSGLINLHLYRKSLLGTPVTYFLQENIISNWSGSSPYNWTIPNSLPYGNYYVHATIQYQNGTLPGEFGDDMSDNYFTIKNL